MTRILVTGATGFIGGRFAEAAVDAGLDVRATVRSWSRAARLARLRVEMVQSDLLDSEAVVRAASGCSAVVHCAVDKSALGEAHVRAAATMTENVLQAAMAAGVNRVVHLSSIAVYGYHPSTESTLEGKELRPVGEPYCDGKIEAERIIDAVRREHGLRVVVLRPTIVYGPFASWTTGTVAAIRDGRAALIDGGLGICNAVYVDDVVEAMLLALSADAFVDPVHISGPETVTWREFYEGHARALGDYLPLPEVDAPEPQPPSRPPSSLRRFGELLGDPRTTRALRSVPVFARMMDRVPRLAREYVRRRLRPNAATSPTISDAEVAIQTTDVTFSIDRARELLGYRPQVGFAQGMQLTADWIRWARI